jgi:peptide-methionine (R)-S-oxide reductase
MFEVSHTDAEWRRMLTPDQYAVLRQSGTERPYTSPLLHQEGHRVFVGVGCDQGLFSPATKFDSRTGWPSVWAPLEHAVAEVGDSSFGMLRTAVNCIRCGRHIGHVFNDGPRPTGLRDDMNGVALTFKPVAA